MNGYFLSQWNNQTFSSWKGIGALSREMLITYGAIAVMIAAVAAAVVEGAFAVAQAFELEKWRILGETTLYLGLIGFFLFSALLYEFLRAGYLRRFATHHSVSGVELNRIYRDAAPSVAILIPSYKEEPAIVRRTMMAAALQQSPNRRIVLLIDDPPIPASREDAVNLASIRALPRELNRLFAGPRTKFDQALTEFLDRNEKGSVEVLREAVRLAALHEEAALWLETEAGNTPIKDHYDALYAEQVLRATANAQRARASAIRTRLNPCKVDFELEYRRLAALFRVEISGFERKQYENLSHEPNKAMNLNSYIGLMGMTFHEIDSPEGLILRETAQAGQNTIRIPNDDFVVILDADSLLMPTYTLRLIHFMTRAENSRVAVVQTPYSSVPGAANEIERIAGATTDVQLMSHQGSTLFGAGSWVGASALIRRAALEEIATTQNERGHAVPVIVRERTLTEDTDTTIDLIRKNWTVHNYPDRLAYSATPSDFGSLLIQRRRWATGGLIILGNVARYFFEKPSVHRLVEAAVRANYILSAPVGSIGMVILAVYPFSSYPIAPAWLYTVFFVYLFTYSRDLRHNGNRLRDLFRAMALNAMLLPINLSGAFNSLEQLITGRKIPFQRTPKVPGRTAAPPIHVAAQLILLGNTTVMIPVEFVSRDWLQLSFFLFYACAYGYVIPVYLGWRTISEDLLAPLVGVFDRLMKPVTEKVLFKSWLNRWRPANEE